MFRLVHIFRLVPGVFLAVLAVLLPAAVSEAAAPGTVRVVLERDAADFGFKVTGNYQLVDLSTGRILSDLKPGTVWQVRQNGSRMELRGGGDRLGPFRGPVAVREARFHIGIISGSGDQVEKYSREDLVVLGGDGRPVVLERTQPAVCSAGGTAALAGVAEGLQLVALTGSGGTTRYRGDMEFQVENGALVAINELHIEDYLRGVVPREMPAGWPEEALKAQAVAARNYALQRVEATRGSSYNVTGDQLSQVYGGYDAESPATSRAVEATRGLVMECGGRLITAFFHSSSGGSTENAEDVWENPVPYIRGREDPYDKNDRYYDWRVEYTADQLAGQLRSYDEDEDYDFAEVDDLEELARTASGLRVEKMAVTGTDSGGRSVRTVIAPADKVRFALGLRSAMFDLDKVYDRDGNLSGVVITGSGWGHGLGMSQWGARGMAEQGYNFQDILEYYYTGIRLDSGYGRSS